MDDDTEADPALANGGAKPGPPDNEALAEELIDDGTD